MHDTNARLNGAHPVPLLHEFLYLGTYTHPLLLAMQPLLTRGQGSSALGHTILSGSQYRPRSRVTDGIELYVGVGRRHSVYKIRRCSVALAYAPARLVFSCAFQQQRIYACMPGRRGFIERSAVTVQRDDGVEKGRLR